MRICRACFLLFLVLVASGVPAPGCASPRKHSRPRGKAPDVPEGIFHCVEPGQTLWRIARAYGVEAATLAKLNRVSDPTSLAAGQVLFVPDAKAILEVAPYPAPPPVTETPPARSDPEETAHAFVLAWPVAGGEILSPFGAERRGRPHAGLDIRGTFGQDVLAADDGEVVYSGDTLGAYGKLIILAHADRCETLYAHNSELLVVAGEKVARGQAVARVGRSGNASTDHCHFELRKNKIPVDPMAHFPVPGK